MKILNGNFGSFKVGSVAYLEAMKCESRIEQDHLHSHVYLRNQREKSITSWVDNSSPHSGETDGKY